MIHKIISTIGLGILGIDPITAVYLLTMSLRREKKTKITIFFLSFAGFSIVIGAALSTVFGAAAVEILEKIMPDDNSPFWAVLNFSISVFIFIWVFKKLLVKGRKKEENKRTISGSYFKHVTTGFIFVLTCFTDPTYYAVLLLGEPTKNFFTAAMLIIIWFVVSQFMAIMVYIANELNALDKLTGFTEKIKQKNLKPITYIFYAILLIIAILLLVDTGHYLFAGKYLF